MKARRILALLLALMMTAPSVISCSEQTSNESTSASADPSVSVETEAETEPVNPRLAIPDNLPEKDFGGRDFIVTMDSESNSKFIYVEELNGEGVNDSVFARNLALQERFNAKVSVDVSGDYTITSSNILKAVQAGDAESFQLIASHVVSLGGLVQQGVFLNWYDFDNIDFTQPWWAKSSSEDLTINNCCFLAVGDAAVSAVANSYCTFYDKDTAAKYSLENMYDVVKEGRWTADYVMETAAKVYVDENGNGLEDEGDYYGFASDLQSNVNAFLWAFGGKIMNRNAEGNLEFVYYNEHLVEIIDKTILLFNETPGVFMDQPHGSGGALFNKMKTLFAVGVLAYTTSRIAEFENVYGILPLPKYDENQTEYYSMADGGHDALAVAKNVTDYEFVGIMTEAMCAEAYKQIIPAYYDVCLKQRYASSPEDAEMIELCVESRVFDFGYVYDNWKGVSFIMQNMVPTGKNTISSTFKQGQKMYSKYYQKVIDKFLEYEG